AFIPGGEPGPEDEVEPEQVEPAWRDHYLASVTRLGKAGIKVVADPDAGAERYFQLRCRWEPYVRKLSESGAFEGHEIDPATGKI
ncbi:MAG: hypothetical protein ACJ8M1_02130, partial [Chthoniobacterales bacterium]